MKLALSIMCFVLFLAFVGGFALSYKGESKARAAEAALLAE